MISNVKNRPNKLAKGLTKHYERRKEMGRTQPPTDEVGALIVRGTHDKIGRGMWLFVTKIKVEHPTDKGYFKEVYVLTERGKSRLRTMKTRKSVGLALCSYMFQE